MKDVLLYVREFFAVIDRRFFAACCLWMVVLITLNYRLQLESVWIAQLDSRFQQGMALSLMYGSAFVVPYLLMIRFKWHPVFVSRDFVLLLLVAPVLFALKVMISNPLENLIAGDWGIYLTMVTVLPFKFLVVTFVLLMLSRWFCWGRNDFGVTLKGVVWRPYWQMLACMLPLIVFASTQADFLNAYPRLKQMAFMSFVTDDPWGYRLLYELGYGIDFLTIELFFRGFLVFAFIRHAGVAAILPMATFYCSIHFGKPVLECISSFAGGLILGVLAYRTRSIVGGLLVHLGIAWMMEIGGYLGNLWFR